MKVSSEKPWRPTRAQLLAAVNKTVPDLIAPNLKVLFCGINPGLYSGAVGHHFARPGNRFWRALQASGCTDRLVSPFEDRELLDYGLGVTNLVGRSTSAADALTAEELRAGADALERKVEAFTPAVVAVLGIGAYRVAFSRRRATVGPQPAGQSSSGTGFFCAAAGNTPSPASATTAPSRVELNMRFSISASFYRWLRFTCWVPRSCARAWSPPRADQAGNA